MLDESNVPGYTQHLGGAVVDVPPVHGNLDVKPIVGDEYSAVPVVEEAYWNSKIRRVTDDVLMVKLIVKRLGESAAGWIEEIDEVGPVIEFPNNAWFVPK